MKPLGQHPAPSHVIAHLSDPQMLGDRQLYDQVDTAARVRSALERLPALDPAPDVLVFTGDLADRGEPAAYAVGLRDAAASDAPQDEVHDVEGLDPAELFDLVSRKDSAPNAHEL